ncbi:MAG: hypothetical protein AAF226_14620, partial [Verrucomicrobiota bacterium]
SGKTQRFAYLRTGERAATWGDTGYPLASQFDKQGRQVGLFTFGAQTESDFSGEEWPKEVGFDKGSPTVWKFDFASGLLAQKTDAAGKSVTYDYAPTGKLTDRTWARGITTKYSYDEETGRIETIESSHPKTTPVAFSYQENTQRLVKLTDAAGERLFQYDQYGRVIAETLPQMPGMSIRRSYHPISGQLSSVKLDLDGEIIHHVDYSYVNGQFSGVTSPAGQFNYTYHSSNPSLTTQLATPVSITDYSYENQRDLITTVHNQRRGPKPGAAATISRYDYTNDRLGRRSAVKYSGQVFEPTFGISESTPSSPSRGWDYGYNSRSEVTSSKPLNTEETMLTWQWDHLGNPISRTAGEQEENFRTNHLNQLIGISGSLDPLLPEKERIATYDEDGNTLSLPGRGEYVWDGNNRLIQATTPQGIVRFTYDSKGRRIEKQSFRKAGTGPKSTRTVYVWDSWTLLAEYTYAKDNEMVASKHYTWGRDLSGSLEGAGGVGGLMAITEKAQGDAKTKTYYPLYDANGNVGQLLSESGEVSAAYEYNAFGETARAVGELAKNNPWKFSTKAQDDET